MRYANDLPTIRRFLSYLIDPNAGCLEFRVMGADESGDTGKLNPAKAYPKTYTGYYVAVDHAAIDCYRLNGINGYVTVNPVKMDLVARSRNTYTKSNTSAHDDDIALLRWLFIDIDPRRPSGVSSTESELAASVSRRDKILAEIPGLAESSIWGKSGNGCWILVRLPDFPNDDDSRRRIDDILRSLNRFSDADVVVDQTTKNPSRIMGIPGTWKAKGTWTQDRPHRMATIDSPEHDAQSLPLPAFDVDTFLAAFPPPALPVQAERPKRGRKPGKAAQKAGREAVETAHEPNPEALAAWVDAVLDLVAGDVRSAPQGQGNASIHLAAMKLGEIGAAGALDRGAAEQVVTRAAIDRSPDRPLGEIAATFNSGWNHGTRSPRDLSGIGTLAAPPPLDPKELVLVGMDGADGFEIAVPVVADTLPAPFLGGRLADGPNPNPNIDPAQYDDIPKGQEKNPHRLARAYLNETLYHIDGYRLRYWQDSYWQHNGYHYAEIPEYELRARISIWVYGHFQGIHHARLAEWAMNRDNDPPALLESSMVLVSNIMQAIQGIVLVTSKTMPTAPAWLDCASDWIPTDVLPAKNALIHLPSLVAENVEYSRSHTPKFFNRNSFSYEFSSEAPEPDLWLDLLHERWWPHDTKSVCLLQEWMGYLLTPNTRYQKMLYLIGPPRSGKGTIARVINGMIGDDNCDSPTLSRLENSFSLLGMMGKLVAIFADAKIGAKADTSQIIERLLSITGEDRQTIDRKHKDAFTGKVSARLMVIANEPPKLRDSSNALMSRILPLRMTNSFVENEDNTLTDRLMGELPGILLWAIEGWKRLRSQGKFTVPESSKEMIADLRGITSPILRFIEEECTTGDDYECPVGELYERWKQWIEQTGRKHPGDKDDFGRKLNSVLPNIRRKQVRVQGGRCYVYVGIRALAPYESPAENESFIPQADPADLFSSPVPF